MTIPVTLSDRGRERAALFRAVPPALIASVLIAGLLMASGTPVAQAQQPSGKAATKQTAQPKQAPSSETPVAASGGSDSALRQRVEQLEEQLVDLQVTMGTLESLAKGGGAAPRAAAPMMSGGDETRMTAMEQQIRALQAQVEQMSQQNRSGAARPAAATASAGGFGSTTVKSDRDPIGQIIASPQAPAPAPGPAAAAPTPAFPQATASDATAKQLYEAAYGHLLQQDYASAEAAFDEFLRRFPNDQLSGNAQYWLGETFFVRGQFKAAANAFLKGYQAYARSVKAPDSLLKLAMSLDRLGQKDAACSSYSELTVKFPNAPVNVKSRADSERRRIGCV